MYRDALIAPNESSVSPQRRDIDPRALYRELFRKSPSPDARSRAKAYLEDCLRVAADLPVDLPEDWRELETWMETGAERAGQAYRDYLASRRAGAPRRYFSSHAHALYFLRGVAPTKMVDGAWLYGTLAHWDDPRLSPLVRIYLEELGEGMPAKNHVALYRRLLATHGCDQWDDLEPAYFVQGAIQLALSQHADAFLPELIGFNLGYEQLPLHLLITAFELNELGIDPYYFTLHVTVDNASSGHARRAIEAVRAAMPLVGDEQAFRRRVLAGYRLNELGRSTEAVIASFDPEQEVIDIFRRKSVFGRLVHSDYCRVAGKPVSAWLDDPEQIPDFLRALQASGWIKRNEDPSHSRFWRLLEGDRAEMFGVFSRYELQVIRDWIAGSAQPDALEAGPSLGFRARQRLFADLEGSGEPERDLAGEDDSDPGADARALAAAYNGLRRRDEKMDFLIPLLSPALHWTREGLLATRLFNEGLAH